MPFMSIFAGSIFMTLFVCIIVYVLTSLGKMKCLQKAGEKGWKGFIPVYSTFVMYKVVGLKPFLAFIEIASIIMTIIILVVTLSYTSKMTKFSIYSLTNYTKQTLEFTNTMNFLNGISNIVSLASLAISIFYAIYISKSFGLGGGTIAGMILVPPIFIMIIGFGDSKYLGTYQTVQNTVQ